MSKVYPDFLGGLIGSTGKVSYYMRYGENIARRKAIGGKSSTSPAAVEQRAKFKTVIKLASVLLTVIRLGFPQRKRGRSPSNEFVRLNKDICTVEGNMVTIDYEHLLCTNGQLLTPEVKVTYDPTSKTFTFEQTTMEEEINCNTDDNVYAVLLEREQALCRLIALHQRGENSSTSVALPQKWEREHVSVYIFAQSIDQKKASRSMYLTMGNEV